MITPTSEYTGNLLNER